MRNQTFFSIGGNSDGSCNDHDGCDIERIDDFVVSDSPDDETLLPNRKRK